MCINVTNEGIYEIMRQQEIAGKETYTDAELDFFRYDLGESVYGSRANKDINAKAGLAAKNRARLKPKNSNILSTPSGNQSKVRSVLSSGPVDAASQGLGSGAAKTLLGL